MLAPERISQHLAELDPSRRLEVNLFDRKIPSPLILASGTLVESFQEIPPFLEAGAGAVVPRTTRKIMERKVHPSPHLYQSGRKGDEMMLNAEWTGADIEYWRPYLEAMSNLRQVVMSISGRDILGCTEVCKELDLFGFPYLEVNISCAHSNSRHGFITRNGEHIRTLIDSIKQAGVTTPLVLKLGHSDFIVELANIAKEVGADGIVAVNSFGPLFDFSIDSLGDPQRVLGIQGAEGGMTGAPLFNIALTDVAEIKRQVGLPVIASGGVRTAEHVIKMIMAGAQAVQVYTAAHVKGIHASSIFPQLNQKIIHYMDEVKVENINSVRGRALSLMDEPTNLVPLIPEVLAENCTGCDICLPVCLPQAIDIIPAANKQRHIVEINDQCIGCGLCVQVCPSDALQIK